MKVQRPGIREQVREDMEVLADLAAFLDAHTETGRRYGLAQLLEEFRKALVDELDYRREADNLSRMRELVADHDLIVVPRAVPRPDHQQGAHDGVRRREEGHRPRRPWRGSSWTVRPWPTSSSPPTSTRSSSRASSMPTRTQATCW